MKDINEGEFEVEVLNYKGTVLVDFNADWCGPCRMFRPILQAFAKQHTVGVNIDDNDELAEKYNISTIPCLVVFKDGEEVARKEGVLPEKKILKMVEG